MVWLRAVEAGVVPEAAGAWSLLVESFGSLSVLVLIACGPFPLAARASSAGSEGGDCAQLPVAPLAELTERCSVRAECLAAAGPAKAASITTNPAAVNAAARAATVRVLLRQTANTPRVADNTDDPISRRG